MVHATDWEKDASETATLQISGTRTLVLAKTAEDKLDGVRIVGAQPFAAFQSAIENLLKPAPTPQSPANGKGN